MWDGVTKPVLGRVAEQPGVVDYQVTQTGDNQFVLVSAVAITTAALPKACVRGNYLEVSGRVPAAQIDIAGDCILTDNECVLTTANLANPTVEVTANAVVAVITCWEEEPQIAPPWLSRFYRKLHTRF